ncbi:MAG: hypothetical protein SGILL_004001 [Bacillariaceae sp.]
MDKTVPAPAASASRSSNETALKEKTTASTSALKESPMDGGQQRRSARDHKSKATLIWIDGYAVKKTNNYSVTEGEYVYHDNDLYDTVSPSQKRRVKAAISSSVANKKPKATAPRKASPQELARIAHNNTVKQSKEEKQGLRLAFLKQHAQVLKPFMEDAVYEKLVSSQPEKQPTADAQYRPIKVAQPSLITGGALRDYQLEGLAFLVNCYKQNLGAILGDEMGLGKTVQTCSLLCYLKETEKKQGPSLVVCPLSVLSSWMKELAFWAPSLNVFRLHNSSGSGQEQARRAMMDSFVEYDVIVTTYEMVKTAHLKTLFSRLQFHIMILDEGHKVKCNETLVAGAVRKVHCENRLILTGTPLQNNLVELWSLLELLYPDVFTTKKPFEACFDLNENHIDKGGLLDAKTLLDLFMLRRLKKTVESLLPPCVETQVYCPLSREQVFLYKAILLKDASVLDKANESINSSKKAGMPEALDGSGKVKYSEEGLSQTNHVLLRNIFMQLRKASQHPWVFDGMQSPDATLQEMVAASGKLAVLDMLLCSLYKKGHRVVIFSQFTSTLDILESYCHERGWSHARFDGGTARGLRDYLVNRFNEPKSPYFLFLMSTKSGGVGLNLQTADTCILYDSDWNPQNDLQAMARVHRIGQKKTVHVYRLITSNSVEERMLERATRKLLLDQSVNRESATDVNVGGLGSKELLDDIKFGASAIFGEKTLEDLPSLNDIEQITNRHRKDSDTLGKLKGGTEHNGATFEAEEKFTEGQVFGGIDFRKIREENERKTREEIPKTLKGIGRLWQSIKDIEGKKRERKSRLVMVEGKGSGYGQAQIPVLSSNNYDLLSGETSVFGRELEQSQKNQAAVPLQKKRTFENSSWCQFCLDGGALVCCPRCPVSLHLACCGIGMKDFKGCFHHHCSVCQKNTQEAGGLMYRCSICPWAWCEACIPVKNAGFRYLDSNERWEELKFDSTKNAVYIHCSTDCETYAKKEFNWKPKTTARACPSLLDVSHNFGVDVDKKPAAREVSSPSVFSSEEDESSTNERDNVISLL